MLDNNTQNSEDLETALAQATLDFHGSYSESLFHLVGNTPLVEITDLSVLKEINDTVRVFAKLEMFNFGGSVKDRPALWMIKRAEEQGILTKERILLEPTSGNTGIGLAWIARVKGYRLKIVMPESMSEERKQMLRSFGAELVLTPAAEGTDGAIRHARVLVKENNKFLLLDQFKNQANVESHYEGTGPEIWKQMDGKIDIFVAGIGTSGTITGVGKYLNEKNPKITIVSVEPLDFPDKRIPGLKNLTVEEIPSIYSDEHIAYREYVDKDDAVQIAKELANQALLVGPSSGAALQGLIQFVKKYKDKLEGKKLVVVFPDTGTRYLSQS
ncbi:MAG: PLP-dependent cysteine synthase family protein [Candidatus Hodarchaeales archaeon]|jgi:cysteine synthase